MEGGQLPRRPTKELCNSNNLDTAIMRRTLRSPSTDDQVQLVRSDPPSLQIRKLQIGSSGLFEHHKRSMKGENATSRIYPTISESAAIAVAQQAKLR
jgi:hypothetical protein